MKQLFAGLLLLVLLSCAEREPLRLVGTFTEAEMNTVTVAPEKGAAVTFSTDEAELIGFDYLQPGAPVEVTYEGRIRKEVPTPALRVEVDERYALLCARWIETGEGADAFAMGFELAPRGAAYPIGMQTVVFKRWQLSPEGGVMLAGHTLENGQTVPFSEVWEILELEPDRLIIAQSDLILKFRHETEADIAVRLEREARAAEAQKPKPLKRKK